MSKNRIMSGIMIFMISMFSLVAVAQMAPLPINGKITGDSVSNLPVKVQNLRTLVSKTIYTTGSGEYLVGDSELQGNGYYIMAGDVFRFTILSCETDSRCVKEITYVGQPELFLTFDLTEVDLPDQFGCWDGSIVSDIELCPEQPEPEVEPESSVTSSESSLIAIVEALYGQEIEVKLDDSKLSYLIDGEIDFNGGTYEVKEEIYASPITQTSIDDDDFGIKPYVVIDEYGVEYRYIFNEQIIIADISEDDPLDIIFLGKELKIIDATDSKIVVRYGDKVTLLQGKSDLVNGNTIEITAITADTVSLKVNQVSGSVTIGDTETINGLEVVIDSLLYQGYDNGVKQVTLIVGENVQETYNDGDFFDLFIADSEEWEWIISLGGDDQYIGVWNVEAYQTIDEDDEYHALGVGDSLFLPNNYLEIKFKSITNPDVIDLNIREKDGYLYLRGDTDEVIFSFGTKDYDRVHMNAAGIYDEDFVLITTDKVEIGDSGIYLEQGSAKIGDLTIELDLSDILFKGVSFALKDETFMDYLGIIFSDPENAVEEKRGFEVLVPKDRPEVIIAFGKDIPDEAADVPEGCPKAEVCTTCTEEVCEPEIKYIETNVCPEEKVCSTDPVPEGNLGGIIIASIFALLVGGAGGIYFTRNKVLGVRGGLKVYRGNDGEEKVLHKHSSVRGYHDPSVSHRDEEERHPKGQLYPHYIREDSGRYVYEK